MRPSSSGRSIVITRHLILLGLIALGGGIGSVVRFGFDRLFSAAEFPAGIWVANGVGCFLLGIFIVWQHRCGQHFRHFWTLGLCGGMTTFSAVNTQVWLYLQSGDVGWAFVELAGSLALCLVCTALPWWLFRERRAQ